MAGFQEFGADPRPDKVNLGVGMYYDEDGRIPVLNVVKAAETAVAGRTARPLWRSPPRRPCAIPDGLALSSRNRYLAPEQRAVAPGLYQVLLDTARTGAGPAALADGEARLRGIGMRPEYLVLVEAGTMLPIASASWPARLIAAPRLGLVRLLDNVAVPP